MYVNLCICT